jgi:hypothetical protein
MFTTSKEEVIRVWGNHLVFDTPIFLTTSHI